MCFRSTEACTEGRKRGLRWASGGVPTFHTIGIVTQVMHPLVSGQPIGVFTPQEPSPPVVSTAAKVLDMYRVANCNVVIGVPAFVEVSFEFLFILVANPC